jgi:hypothetical protein
VKAAAALVLAAIGGTLGCNVPLADEAGLGPVNTCSSMNDCAEGAACQQGMCVATSYDLGGLLLEVRPPPNATFGGGRSFVIDPSGGVQLQSSAGGPFFDTFSFSLPPPVTIKGGQVVLDQGTVGLPKGCSLSIPARLTFYRVPKFGGVALAGLPYAPVQVTTTTDAAPYTFDLDIVSGKGDQYDVYVEPLLPNASCSMVVPPVYLPAQTIANSMWRLPPLPPIGTLKGTLNGLMDIAMWQVDLVEPARGLTISASTTLAFMAGDAGSNVTALISPVQGGDAPILRLTPIDPMQPDPKSVDTTRPSVYFSLGGAVSGGTKQNPIVQFAIDDLAATRVEVNGTVASADGLHRMAAQLTIQSQKLSDGSITENVAYSAQVSAENVTGSFDAYLPAGTYVVRASPTADNGWSTTDNPLTVPAGTNGCVCGVPLQLDAKPPLAGTIKTPTGQPLSSTNVGVNPSQQVGRGYLYDTHNLEPIAPRDESTATDASGSFSLVVDKGTCDLVVQPDPSTNYPWLVVPRISPEPGALPFAKTVTNPAILQGTVTDPNNMPVVDAEIDAWFPLRDPGNPNVLIGTVVKIATTSTDTSGRYTLVLPSSITPF